jgi:hypothetical protein
VVMTIQQSDTRRRHAADVIACPPKFTPRSKGSRVPWLGWQTTNWIHASYDVDVANWMPTRQTGCAFIPHSVPEGTLHACTHRVCFHSSQRA